MGDEVWMWLHRKYGMSRTIKNCIHYKQTTSLTLMVQTMVNLIDKKIKLMTWNSQKVNELWQEQY